MKCKDLGFTDWFQEKYKEFQQPGYSIARIVAVNKDNFLIRNPKSEIPAEVTGKILFGAESNLDLPCVGDWVQVKYYNNHTLAIIHQVLPRKSLLKRKTAGKRIEYQPIAANIDTAFIIQSVDNNFNLPRLERYLVMVNESNISPVLLLSKSDLLSNHTINQRIMEVTQSNPHYKILAFSNKTEQGLDEIKNILKTGVTYCLLGSSGVGKTTLLNKLIGKNRFTTSAVRKKDGKGIHVTARRQLILLEQGGLIIDNPGMRELGNFGIESGIKETFNDIVVLSKQCHFKNCTHINEPGCSVLQAVEKGELNKKRYQNYLKIRKEAEYHTMSYYEKRLKDKTLGKFYKKVKKSLRKK